MNGLGGQGIMISMLWLIIGILSLYLLIGLLWVAAYYSMYLNGQPQYHPRYYWRVLVGWGPVLLVVWREMRRERREE